MLNFINVTRIKDTWSPFILSDDNVRLNIFFFKA